MTRILTGIQSTGIPHLGNLLGAIQPAIATAKKTQQQAYFFIADLHALTTQQDPKKIKTYTYATAAAWLACGLDPNQHILYRQSHIPEVCELTWYLACFTNYTTLTKAHAFKDKAANLFKVSAGLFTYPILMAADILLYQATHIPVGKDQKQHIEIARDIAQTLNRQYGNLFTIPQAQIQEKIATIPGIDGRKMSKSYQNTINIFAPEAQLKKNIMQIVTQSTPLEAPKDPNNCPIFNLYQHIAPPNDIQTMKNHYLSGGYGYYAAKKELFTTILHRFKAERKAFDHYMQTPEKLEEILRQGEIKARVTAIKTLTSIRQKMGYRSNS